jgi:hypothetical protein
MIVITFVYFLRNGTVGGFDEEGDATFLTSKFE